MSEKQHGRDAVATAGDAATPAADNAAGHGEQAESRERENTAGGRSPAWVRLWWTPLVVLAVAALLAAGVGLHGLLNRPPAEGSVDVGFARDMSEHHAQAVQMSMVYFARGENEDLRGVAQDMALTQQREIGIMAAWLSGWGRSEVSTAPPMAWMEGHQSGEEGHSGHGGPAGGDSGGQAGTSPRMPGMASEEELGRLAAAQGRELDVLFLTLMVRHHRGGVEMAQYASMHAQEDKVRALARAMVINQSAEIELMQGYLEELGEPRA